MAAPAAIAGACFADTCDDASTYLRSHGIVDGYADGTFRSHAHINRAEFLKIAVGSNFTAQALRTCAPDNVYSFPDAGHAAWYSPYLCIGVQHRIVAGYPDGTFRPQDGISLVEAAKIISIIDGSYVNGDLHGTVLQPGKDVWYEPYVRYLADRNAIPLSISGPSHRLTRGEMAEIIYRLHSKNTALPSQSYEDIAGIQKPSTWPSADVERVLSSATNFNFPFQEGEHGQLKHVRLLTQNGTKEITQYDPNISYGKSANTYLTVPDGDILIHGIGAAGFSVFDYGASDRTASYRLFQEDTIAFSPYKIDEDRYAYGIHGFDSTDDHPGGFYVARADGSRRKFTYPEGVMGMAPLCMSGDGKSIYVRSVGWEGFSYISVWKIRLSDLAAMSVFTNEDKIATFHCRNKSDQFVVAHTEEQDVGMGTSAPPSSLEIFDVSRGTSKMLASSPTHIFEDPVITPDGKRVVYRKVLPGAQTLGSKLYVMNLDGSNEGFIGNFDRLAGVSFDGSVVVADRFGSAQGSGFERFVVSEQKGSARLEGRMETLNCGYGMGFDCLYP